MPKPETPPLTAEQRAQERHDLLKDFIGAIGDRPFVFWTCFNGCRGMVTWSNNCTEAVCGDCGARRSEDPRIATILAEGENEADGK